ncbi:MarR family winged helix-turn-helix transcriptional regulator [Marinomonas sp. PE14-40]|uniref:MarR family winged helix-turn-helix transcriptional regulator n=1 Tax=Marinomonas sp. PE14-40 TaxID=3060621 RepID=UPI003F675F57
MSNLNLNISLLMETFIKKFFKAMDNAIKELDLPITHQDTMLIMVTFRSPGLTIGELVESVCRDKSQITRKIKELESKNLLIRKSSETDARVSKMYLTDEAKIIAEKLDVTRSQVLNKMLVGLDKEEASSLAMILGKLSV